VATARGEIFREVAETENPDAGFATRRGYGVGSGGRFADPAGRPYALSRRTPDLSHSRPYSAGGSIHFVVPQGSQWNTVADLPFAARGGMCANWRIGTAHFSQCGGAVAGPNMP
jgi:hypothetical protein